VLRVDLNFPMKSLAVDTPENFRQKSFLSALNIVIFNWRSNLPLGDTISLNVICHIEGELLVVGGHRSDPGHQRGFFLYSYCSPRSGNFKRFTTVRNCEWRSAIYKQAQTGDFCSFAVAIFALRRANRLAPRVHQMFFKPSHN